MPEKRPFERLPADVSPLNYGLCLKPDLIDFTFEGKLEAAVQAQCCTESRVLEKIKKLFFKRSNPIVKVTLSAIWTAQNPERFGFID
ncbi:hypothetical protein HGM15179_019334 [Zosterops borbonicus]|uniref:Uncharacterized protein n=1 Tax=Zosterops borbonicus TaxID=364589 RepID=A0A8K1DBQ9_9PASS|nr:hypothetical protein HGM15179_019334 [Zosterops borbonicus]